MSRYLYLASAALSAEVVAPIYGRLMDLIFGGDNEEKSRVRLVVEAAAETVILVVAAEALEGSLAAVWPDGIDNRDFAPELVYLRLATGPYSRTEQKWKALSAIRVSRLSAV